MDFFEYSNFDYSNWKRPEHTVATDVTVRTSLYHDGFYIKRNFLDRSILNDLVMLYDQNHEVSAKKGGMFVSIYSKDIAYRKRIDHGIREILSDRINSLFEDFKSNGYNFIVKYPGKHSEMFPHQDMPFVDEAEFSEVGVWIPLQQVGLENGCLGIVPATHFSIPPVRSLHHKLPFSDIYEFIRQYFIPVEMNLGDVLLYDPRILHNSFENKSSDPRLAIATRISPKQADYVITFKDQTKPSADFEQIQVADDFFLNFDDFISDKVRRPTGKLLSKVEVPEATIDQREFEEFCKLNKLEKQKNTNFNPIDTISISEPAHRSEAESSMTVRLMSKLFGIKI